MIYQDHGLALKSCYGQRVDYLVCAGNPFMFGKLLQLVVYSAPLTWFELDGKMQSLVH